MLIIQGIINIMQDKVLSSQEKYAFLKTLELHNHWKSF